MTTITERLRADAGSELSQAAAAHIDELTQRIANQQTVMDKAACVLAEASASEDGIDEQRADECIAAIRGSFAEIGKTTAELFLERLYDRIAATAGIGAGVEFNPIAVLDQIRTVLAAQSKNARYLEWALSVLWTPGNESSGASLITEVDAMLGKKAQFPAGTNWMEALDDVLAATPPAADSTPRERTDA